MVGHGDLYEVHGDFFRLQLQGQRAHLGVGGEAHHVSPLLVPSACARQPHTHVASQEVSAPKKFGRAEL